MSGWEYMADGQDARDGVERLAPNYGGHRAIWDKLRELGACPTRYARKDPAHVTGPESRALALALWRWLRAYPAAPDAPTDDHDLQFWYGNAAFFALCSTGGFSCFGGF